jgi:transcriptional regulator with XRE-family HTH domain
MFYDNFVNYCNNVSKSPSAVASELGLSRASVNGWKNGKIPTDANQIKIAQYFGVSVAELMSEQKEKPAQNVQVRDEHDNIVVFDDETRDLIDSLRSKPEMKMLFSVSKGATKEDIIRTVKIIEALKDKKEGD